MNKIIATICVISWAGFWAFGYLALSANIENADQVVIALVLAALGLFTGVFTYLKIARSSDPERWKRVKQAEGA